MADFEGLIRQALARQENSDPAVRQRVYQSSRNALAKMIAASGASDPSAIIEQRTALENSINRIEAGFLPLQRPSAPQPVIVQPRAAAAPIPVRPASPQPVPAQPKQNPAPAASKPVPRPVPQPQPEPKIANARQEPDFAFDDRAEDQYPPEVGFDMEADELPSYRRKSGALRRVLPIALALVILVVGGWLVYTLVTTVIGAITTAQTSQPATSADNGETPADATGELITVLSPTDTASLQTDGRGTAEIVNQSNVDMVRLTSIRAEGKKDDPAEPILLEIAEGTLSRIAGKRVTVEILAKSGSASPATFAIGCDFAGEDACGRKRFRVGLQPEAIVFTVSVPQTLSQGGKAYLTLSTDVTSTASLSAKGDPVDIGYAKLRFATE